MVKVTKTSEAKTAYGVKLEQPFSYTYTYEIYPDSDEGRAEVMQKDPLKHEEQRVVRNNEALANARQKELKAQLDARGIVEPTAENDPQIGLMEMYFTLQTAKKPDGSRRHSNERAREIATENLGVDWTEASIKTVEAADRKAEAKAAEAALAAAKAAEKAAEAVTIQ